MPAYYVEWHMRQQLKPMLFDNEYLATPAYSVTHTACNPGAKMIITTRPTPFQEKPSN